MSSTTTTTTASSSPPPSASPQKRAAPTDAAEDRNGDKERRKREVDKIRQRMEERGARGQGGGGGSGSNSLVARRASSSSNLHKIISPCSSSADKQTTKERRSTSAIPSAPVRRSDKRSPTQNGQSLRTASSSSRSNSSSSSSSSSSSTTTTNRPRRSSSSGKEDDRSSGGGSGSNRERKGTSRSTRSNSHSRPSRSSSSSSSSSSSRKDSEQNNNKDKQNNKKSREVEGDEEGKENGDEGEILHHDSPAGSLDADSILKEAEEFLEGFKDEDIQLALQEADGERQQQQHVYTKSLAEETNSDSETSESTVSSSHHSPAGTRTATTTTPSSLSSPSSGEDEEEEEVEEFEIRTRRSNRRRNEGEAEEGEEEEGEENGARKKEKEGGERNRTWTRSVGWFNKGSPSKLRPQPKSPLLLSSGRRLQAREIIAGERGADSSSISSFIHSHNNHQHNNNASTTEHNCHTFDAAQLRRPSVDASGSSDGEDTSSEGSWISRSGGSGSGSGSASPTSADPSRKFKVEEGSASHGTNSSDREGVATRNQRGKVSKASSSLDSFDRPSNVLRRSNPVHANFSQLARSRSVTNTTVDSILSRSYSSGNIEKREFVTIKFKLRNQTIRVQVPDAWNPTKIKEEVLLKAMEVLASTPCRENEEEANSLKPPVDYILKIRGVEYYLTNDNLPLHRVDVIQVCKKSYISAPLEMLMRPPDEVIQTAEEQLNVRSKMHSELTLYREVFELTNNPLTGNPLKQLLASGHAEAASFRKRIARSRRSVMKARSDSTNSINNNVTATSALSSTAASTSSSSSTSSTRRKYNTEFLPQYRESEPVPLHVPEKIDFICYLPGKNEEKSTIDCTPDQSVDELTKTAFNKFRRVDLEATRNTTYTDYILKVTGLKEYLFGQRKLISYDYIRKSLGKKQKISLSLVPLSEVDLMIPKPVDQSIVDMILCREKDPDSEISSLKKALRKSVKDVEHQLRVKISGVENVDNFNQLYNELKLAQKKKKEKVKENEEKAAKKAYCLFLVAQLYHGDSPIADDMYTSSLLYSNNPLWNEWLVTSLRLKDIPRGSRLCFTLYRRQYDSSSGAPPPEKVAVNRRTDVPLGWVNCQFINHKNELIQGPCSLKLWFGKNNPIGTCMENVISQDNPPVLYLEFYTTKYTIYFPPYESSSQDASSSTSSSSLPKNKQETEHNPELDEKLELIVKKDPLTALTKQEQELIWEHREYCTRFSKLLPRFLQSTRWNDNTCVEEVYRLLPHWKPPSAFDALQLLDAKYASPVVREYAVSRLTDLGDRECADFLLQLTQVLKYEAYHDSALAKFLLSRALRNNNQIGHAFFWHLKSEMHNPTIASRYSLLSEAYLRGCGEFRQVLLKQNSVLNQLARVAMKVKEARGTAERKQVLLKELSRIDFPEKFQLPLDPRQEVRALKIEDCKYMDSKKMPLWLVFENAEARGDPIYVIFKAGDDLRQDVLTLQMLRIMDKLWKNEGLDLRLNAYGCVATGDELGLIEVVLNAATTASINKEAGGSKAVLYKDTLSKWLQAENPSKDLFEKARENFLLSCAGYCVATYVLGIGDRHNDNIMLTKSGHLFHIDFGHFLGNYKSKYGFKRERAPFIFNPQFSHILTLHGHNDLYKEFEQTCGRAYNILRKHADMFINLFMMMLSTGIPELQCEEDIEYMRDSFSLDLTDEQAADKFKKLIRTARKTKAVMINDIIHIWAHSKT